MIVFDGLGTDKAITVCRSHKVSIIYYNIILNRVNRTQWIIHVQYVETLIKKLLNVYV